MVQVEGRVVVLDKQPVAGRPQGRRTAFPWRLSAGQRLDAQAAQATQARRYELFHAKRDEVRCHASLSTGLDALTNSERVAARRRPSPRPLAEADVLIVGTGWPSRRAPTYARAGGSPVTLAEAVAYARPGRDRSGCRERLTKAVRFLEEMPAQGVLPNPSSIISAGARYLQELGHRRRGGAPTPLRS